MKVKVGNEDGFFYILKFYRCVFGICIFWILFIIYDYDKIVKFYCEKFIVKLGGFVVFSSCEIKL